MRVFVTVPEEFSDQVRPGTKASMDVTELPNRHFAAAVTRTTDAIDATSRTLTVELDVPNPSGELLPGAYANVHFQLPLNVVPLVLPSSTILFQADGPQVGVVNSQNQVELRKVTLGHDFGDTIEIMTGVRSDGRRDRQSSGFAHERNARRRATGFQPTLDAERELTMLPSRNNVAHCSAALAVYWPVARSARSTSQPVAPVPTQFQRRRHAGLRNARHRIQRLVAGIQRP